ncbi:hypothetical protein KM043_010612 [Ampulex compressa]|nr:hypothetical protein KM043_010612 [Ampulex compressa]
MSIVAGRYGGGVITKRKQSESRGGGINKREGGRETQIKRERIKKGKEEKQKERWGDRGIKAEGRKRKEEEEQGRQRCRASEVVMGGEGGEGSGGGRERTILAGQERE